MYVCLYIVYFIYTAKRLVFLGLSDFHQMLGLATKNFQDQCNHNHWSGLLWLCSVQF